jgi:hypothetical protein
MIDRGIRHIQENGWVQVGATGPQPPGGACMSNAVAREFHRDGVQSLYTMPEYEALIAELDGMGISDVWNFNDNPATSLEDVLEVMKRASARLDEASA